MTPFEVIIISLIYLFCYGYILAMFIKEENVWLRIFLSIACFALALYAPLLIGGKIFEKLNSKKNL